MKISSAFFVLSMFTAVMIDTSAQENPAAKKLEGRWDLTIDMNGTKSPSWLEVSHSGFRTLVGRFVGVSGSARPVSEVTLNGDNFSFVIPPQWEDGAADMIVTGEVGDNGLSG
ncbi:MAG TPA: hypothetical protein VKZ68_03075, partial [Ohtaekwangia sp.]|nr:hypothetical protein [Ohtaekwangia sp.]